MGFQLKNGIEGVKFNKAGYNPFVSKEMFNN